ncbi:MULTISPECIES: DUF5671 domain-containing protein [Micrococcaceae]|uniref:DUF5671 domain-containing protein n=1 Tax=Arthrobacter sedimenti TaxID=2694931 RepID=A0ABV8WJ52_9MICC|nr:DUF5671 domain-containing protein [Pseudarthrobacter defluvii]WJH26544.1 hypothetical protein JCQ34_16705 [Pseudarthrobacter defluvii]
MTAPAAPTVPAPAGGLATLRRLILYVLLFALVVITASGVSGLLERLFRTATTLVSGDVTGLALSLAFTLIGGPLALLLWWFVWRRLDDEAERRAPGWGLYLTGMYAVSLIIASTSLLDLATSFIGTQESQWPSPLANGLVWSAIWWWHRWMWKHPVKASRHLEDVRAVVGSVFGLLLGTGAAIAALSALLDVAIRGFTATAAFEPWWFDVLRSLVWAAGGALVWWWHWFREGGRRFQTGLVDVAIIGVGIFLAGITALGGLGVILFVLLRLAFDRSDPMDNLLEPLAPAIAAAAIGALVWRYHRSTSVHRSTRTRRASLLVTSAVALAAAASGIGVVVNALLAAAVSPLAGGATRTLLLGGISSLAVGAPVWWLAWKPRHQPRSADEIPPGRRVYLVAFFGVSAVVALITLLVIGYRLFEYLLGEVTGGSVLDRIRAPLGLLVAAGLVAGYHFALWRRDRTLLAAAAPAHKRVIERVTLVSGYRPDALDPEALARGIADATGAKVTTWLRADDGGAGLPPSSELSPAAGDVLRQVVAALQATAGQQVLVIAGPGTRLEVVPLMAPGAAVPAGPAPGRVLRP